MVATAEKTKGVKISDSRFKKLLKELKDEMDSLELEIEAKKDALTEVRKKRKAVERDLLAVISDGTDPQLRLQLNDDDDEGDE